MKLVAVLLGHLIVTLASCTTTTQPTKNNIKIIGQMRNVMWKGQLYGNINIDTIVNKINLYGLGPVEYLAGEILVMDGKSYKSTAISDSTMRVDETYSIQAPFFAYANIAKWSEQILPDSIHSIQQLERYLDIATSTSSRPFMFKLSGTVEEATIHIVNLPKASKVSSPDDAHEGQKNYKLKNEPSDLIGFFSTKHKAIFTHHDTFLHIHLITLDKQKMGHLDKALFKKGAMSLYLPIE
jgi:acetolactate decarboxylase